MSTYGINVETFVITNSWFSLSFLGDKNRQTSAKQVSVNEIMCYVGHKRSQSTIVHNLFLTQVRTAERGKEKKNATMDNGKTTRLLFKEEKEKNGRENSRGGLIIQI